MSLNIEFFKANVDSMFIAYSFVYIEDALAALRNAPEQVEAIIIQPYRKGSNFVSADKAVSLYQQIKNGQNIPILFTPQGRRSEKGQFFEYGARLLEVLDETNRSKIKQYREEGKWILPASDKKLYATNFLIVKKPIVRLPKKLPIGIAINILRGKTRGEPVQAVSIPAPKQMSVEYRDILKIENFA